MIRKKDGFIIKFEEGDKDFVENLDTSELISGYKKAKEFFRYEGEVYPIRICFLY